MFAKRCYLLGLLYLSHLLAVHGQALAQSRSDTGGPSGELSKDQDDSSSKSQVHEMNHEPQDQKAQSPLGAASRAQGIVTHKDLVEAAQPRVRIGLRLTTFLKTVAKDPQGKSVESYVSREPLRHTLRARLNKVNHFYLGSWHVETTPLKWIRESRRYDIRLSVYRRYGAYDLLEELVGHVDLSGVLEQQEENVYVLKGVVRERIRDKFGYPLLDIVAGYEPEETVTTGKNSIPKPSKSQVGKG